MLIDTVFWGLVGLLAYTWAGYRILLAVGSKWRQGGSTGRIRHSAEPCITVVVTVHNEEKRIAARLENLLALRYRGHLDIVVASDGSSDQTERIVTEYQKQHRRVRLIKSQRLGKSGAQNAALSQVDADIVVLTDGDSAFAPDFVERVVPYFDDPSVGCVTTRLMLRQEEGAISDGLNLYWRYELSLRKLESTLGILATASGSCMAVRRCAFNPFEPYYGDDCVIPLDMRLRGYRTVYAEDAVAWDRMPATWDGEMRARRRMTARNIAGTLSRAALLNPLGFSGVAWSLWSHKLLRWLSPVMLLLLTVASALAWKHGPIYQATLLGELFVCAVALIGWRSDVLGRRLWPGIAQIYSFMLANLGFALGLMDALGGRRITSYNRLESRPIWN